MTILSTLELCAVVSLPIFGMAIVARQRDAARESATRFKDFWIDASGRALRAEARLDLVHRQHVDAGKASHELTEEERAKIRATTIALAEQIGKPELAAPLQTPNQGA